MHPCPSLQELRLLLDGQVTAADEQRISSHLDACAACCEAWDGMTGGFSTRLADYGQSVAAAPLSEFLKGLQEHQPEELFEPEPEDDRRPPIQFPGPPTLHGKLGQLEHFHIKKELGQGATGFVFHAWDEKLDRAVAIKVLNPESYAIDLVRKRFDREARAAAGVDHEHIIKVHEIRRTPNFPPYIVMHYVDGESVAQLLDHRKTLEPKDAARIVLHVTEGLAAAHAHGLVHRDIKPSNILLKKDDSKQDSSLSAVITDFGLARTTAVRDKGPRGRVTRSGDVIGTPEYMSPEQIASPKSLDGRSDLFSLGAVLYELVTGTPPFQGASTQDTLRLIRFEEPKPPRQLNAKIPRDLQTICLKCLEKEPRKRYDSAETLADDLKHLLANEPICARPVGQMECVWRWCRRKPLVAGLIAGIAFLLVAYSGSTTGLTIWALVEKDRAEQARVAETKRRHETRQALDEITEPEIIEQWLSRQKELLPEHKEFLKRALAYYEEFARDTGEDEASRAGVARAYGRVAYIQ